MNAGSWLNNLEIDEKYAQIDEGEMEIPSDSSDEERPRTNDNLSSDSGKSEEMKDKLMMSDLLNHSTYKGMNAPKESDLEIWHDKPQLNADDILEELRL